MSVVYTGGTFDILHRGHINLLRGCRRIAGQFGIVIVSLNRDEFIERYKGRPPVMSYVERHTVLAALRDVDSVIENSGDEDSRPAIERARPNYIVVGSDWQGRDYHAQMGFTPEWLAERGIEIIYQPYTEGISSTLLKEHL